MRLREYYKIFESGMSSVVRDKCAEEVGLVD